LAAYTEAEQLIVTRRDMVSAIFTNGNTVPDTFTECIEWGDMPLFENTNPQDVTCNGNTIGSYEGLAEDHTVDWSFPLRNISDATTPTLIDFIKYQGVLAGVDVFDPDYTDSVQVLIDWTTPTPGTHSVTYVLSDHQISIDPASADGGNPRVKVTSRVRAITLA
jgi:hypothetical protein